jgi:flavin reductase (DIM6/NTAB) family NADH-FMN oxidoreductase RutF
MTEPEGLDRFSAQTDVPLTIVTTVAGGKRSGCVVGYWTRSSIDPPRFLVCISRQNHTFGFAMTAEEIALHLVPAKAVDIVRLFGSETGDEIDKFAHCEWREGPGGLPILGACPTHAVCKVLDRIDAGDHVALLVDPVTVTAGPEEAVFTQRMAAEHHIVPGHPA